MRAPCLRRAAKRSTARRWRACSESRPRPLRAPPPLAPRPSWHTQDSTWRVTTPVKSFGFCSILLLAPLCLPAQDLKAFEKKVTEFTLTNGLHFIVVERHEAPVVSFHTYVNAGSVDDPSGATGIAHMFEHMAFKGTETIGSR